GGGRQHEFSALEVELYVTASCNFDRECAFKYVDHVDGLGQVRYPIEQKFIHTNIPLSNIVPYVSVRVALKIARLHGLQIGSHVPKLEICCILEGHNCISCNLYVTVFAIIDSKPVRRRKYEAEKNLDDGNASHVTDSPLLNATTFPPAPLSNDLSLKVISGFCADSLLVRDNAQLKASQYM
ncbi:hypothetical protein BYT27DRAFT_7089787, partial [Phlegmacium glaucopus]